MGALVAALSAPAFSTTVELATSQADAAYGQWQSFNISDLDAQSMGVEWIDNANTLSPSFGTPLLFSFTIDAGQFGELTVVDAGFAGDTFRVTNAGLLLGATSAVTFRTYADIEANSALDAGTDFDAALASSSFSRGVHVLQAGSYRVTGALLQSVGFDDVTPLNSTVGGIRLTVSPVPEPASAAMMFAGLALFSAIARRRS